MQTHEKYNSVFLSTEPQFAGHLMIAGAESNVKLIGKSFWPSPEVEYTDIHGTLNDGKKASLLDCVIQGKTRHRFDEDSQCESAFFPNYIVVGESFIRSDEHVIRAVRYHFDNVSSLLRGYETFRSLDLNIDETLRILEEDHRHSQKLAEKHGWSIFPFKPEIGEHPRLLYFSGLWEIIAFQCSVGNIALTNRTSQTSGDAAGIGISNEVTINIEFIEPKTLNEALHALRVLHGLFELSLGHRQRYQWIELELTHPPKDTEHNLAQMARLYWSLCNERVNGESKASLRDSLLAPDQRPDEFSQVAMRWIDSSATMRDPRERFATAFFSGYSIDRIVGAANMFDLLPESHVPRTRDIDDPLRDAVIQCRKIFTALPASFGKQSVLSALGRVGKASLRDKVMHLAHKVNAAADGRFPNLLLPCHHAVLCRNHYVHGTEGAFDYQGNFTEFAFITDTLEFVFAISDLIDLGWDLKRWLAHGFSMTHAFGVYVVNYPENLRRLEALVKK